MIKKIINGKLKALTGLHVGSGESAETTDSPVFRNVNGEIIIPGTSIAGPLRMLATRIAPHIGLNKCAGLDEKSTGKSCECKVCDLFGCINPCEDSDKGSASKIWVYDAVLDSNAKISIRDGVGIDRETGSSSRAMRAKYDLEVIQKDSLFSFNLAIQDDVDKEQENLLALALTEWLNERCYLGGGAARGLGNMQLTELKVYNMDLSKVENLMNFLKNDDPLKIASDDKDWLENKLKDARKTINPSGENHLYNSFAQIEFTLEFTEGFVINDSVNAVKSSFDFYPKMENGSFIIPGSSLRGILRFHAEKIARSLVTLKSNGFEDFSEKCPACNPFTDIKDPLTSCNALLSKHDDNEAKDNQLCLACRVFGCSYKGGKVYVCDGVMTTEPQIKIMDFLAVDRFTGGGKDSAKFDALTLWRPSFKARIFIENPEDWQLGWMMLVLKDLKEGFLSVGFGANKWFGKATTKDETIKIGKIIHAPEGLEKSNSFEGIFNTQTMNLSELIKETNMLIEKWVSAFHTTLNGFKRESNLIIFSDTYFNNNNIQNLYPKEVKI